MNADELSLRKTWDQEKPAGFVNERFRHMRCREQTFLTFAREEGSTIENINHGMTTTRQEQYHLEQQLTDDAGAECEDWDPCTTCGQRSARLGLAAACQ